MKIALVAPDYFSLWIFRKVLMEKLLAQGHTVYAVCGEDKYKKRLTDRNLRTCSVPFSRFMNPVHDLRLISAYYRIFRKEKFDLIHTFTIKPNLYAVLTGWLTGTRKLFPSITGLGYLSPFSQHDSIKSKVNLKIIRFLYNWSCRASKRIWFQNTDDKDYFLKNKLMKAEKAVVIKSSGVDVEYFNQNHVDSEKVNSLRNLLSFNNDTRLVTMITRPLINKGVHEFIECSENIGRKFPNVIFLLVGGIEEGNSLALTEEYLKSKESANFRWLTHRDDIREIQSLTTVSVLPSYYPEGVPRNLLEAMAMGNPIVTTDHVGCRETVEDGENGYLVPTRDSAALQDKIESLLSDDTLREQMGKRSRKKAACDFSEKMIANRIISELYHL